MPFSKHKKIVTHYPESIQIKIKVFQNKKTDAGAGSALVRDGLEINSADKLFKAGSFTLLKKGPADYILVWRSQQSRKCQTGVIHS